MTEEDICEYIQEHLNEIFVNKQKSDLTEGKSIGRLFYETFTKVESSNLVSILNKLLEYDSLNEDEKKFGFLNTILLSVGVNVSPYDASNVDLYEIRRKKDIDSLRRVNEILAEYNSYNMLSREIVKQKTVLDGTKALQIDDTMKEVLVSNCISKIEELEDKQKDLRYYKEFERAEKYRISQSILEQSKYVSETSLSTLDSEIELIKNKISEINEKQEKKQEKQEETQTKSVRRKR